MIFEIDQPHFIMKNGLFVDLTSLTIRTALPISKGGRKIMRLAKLSERDAQMLREAGYTVAEDGPRRNIGLKYANGVTLLVARERLPSLLAVYCNWEFAGYVVRGDLAEMERLALEGYRL